MSNQPTVTYTRGKDFSSTFDGAGGIGGLLARSESAASTVQTAFYHADGNGNITCLISTNQLLVARYAYDPFGNILLATGPLADANTMQSSSLPKHRSGLVLYLLRAYDPNLQRWLNQDRIAERGGINLFAFTGNNPIGKIDRFGLLPVGFVKSKDDNRCCTSEKIQAGKTELLNKYNEIEKSLLSDNVPRKSTNPNYSCISINGYVLQQIKSAPPCWVCWLERRGKTVTIPWVAPWRLDDQSRVYDHWVVICESLPTSGTGEQMVFDYWENRNGAAISNLENEWPYSFPKQSITGGYGDCSGKSYPGDREVGNFGRPPAR